LQDLRLHLDQAQQQTSALAAEKAALEERLSHLTQILQQEVQLKQQAEQQVSQLQAQLSQAQLSQTQTSQTSALTLLPRSADFQTLALPRAFSRPIVDRPTPWEIPRRSLVITHTKPPSPSDLSDEDIGWFD